MAVPSLPSGTKFLVTEDGKYLLASSGAYILVIGSSLSFSQFTSQPCLEPVCLITIEPRQILLFWTAVAGTSFTYKTSAPKNIREDRIPSGIYADIIGVKYNSVALTAGIDLALGDPVNDLARGEWRYDAPNEDIHIRIASNGTDFNPSLANSVLATRRLHIASMGVVYDDFYYEPRLDAASEIVLKQEVDDLLFGSLKDVGSGTLKIHNGDGIFDTIGDEWVWTDSLIKIKFGGTGMLIEDFVTLMTASSGNIGFGFNNIELPVRTINRLTSKQIPINRYSLTTYPNMDESKIGNNIPVFVGNMVGIAPTLVDSTVQKGLYSIADSASMGLHAVTLVTHDGSTMTAGVDYDLDLPACTLTWRSGSGITPTTGSNIRITASGPIVNASMSYATSSDYLKYFGEQSMWIYSKLLDITKVGFSIDDTVTKNVDGSKPFEQSMFISDSKSASTYIRNLEIGVLGRTEQTDDGVLQPTLFTYTGTTSGIGFTAIYDEEISATFPDPQRTRVFSEARVLYGFDLENNTYEFVSTNDTQALHTQLNGRVEIREVKTQLISGSDALSLSADVLFLSKDPAIKMEMVMNGIGLMDRKIGDKIRVNLDRGLSTTGSWENKIFEIQGIEKKISPIPQVTLILNDMTTSSLVLTGNSGFWTAYTNSWSTAPPAEKETSGYWSDPAGFIDPADPSTQNIKVWI